MPGKLMLANSGLLHLETRVCKLGLHPPPLFFILFLIKKFNKKFINLNREVMFLMY